IADVEPGTYYLSAQRAGYVRQEYGARRSSRQGTALALTEGQEMKGLLIKLTPQGVITGKVLDEDAEPVTRASVQALSQRYLRGKRQLAPAGMAQANDIGEYRLSGLAPGKYILSVTPQRPMDFGLRMRAPRKQEEDAYVTTYYPNVNDGSQALPIDVTAGGEMRGMDFRLHKIKTVHVRGTVIDGADNTPAQNAMVMLAPAGSTIMGAFGRNMAMIREGGAFDIPGVGPGSYSLVVNKMSREGRGASVHQQVNVGNKDLDGLSIVLTPPFTLSGIVRMEGQDKPQFPNARILLDGMDGLTMNTPNATVAADGTFTLQNVSAGQFRINITGLPANSYVKSVKAGNQEALETGADIAGPVPVEIVLSPNAGQITGSVQDAKQQPLSGVTVVLAPDASRRSQYWLFKTAATSQTGGFTLSGIPPGEYTLLSWEDIEDGAYQDPDVVARYESQGKKITIKDGSSETVQVQAIPADGASQN
ncbi:MAG TPA: carboxypeptidase-like regulatory domain-containing protein, partial [Bryobacteraceae bacterium]|nr:carboxypeptidase-like regulatory domain-containing protein [Bryobacteraceae bacterium]